VRSPCTGLTNVRVRLLKGPVTSIEVRAGVTLRRLIRQAAQNIGLVLPKDDASLTICIDDVQVANARP